MATDFYLICIFVINIPCAQYAYQILCFLLQPFPRYGRGPKIVVVVAKFSKICTGDYVEDLYIRAKFHRDKITLFCPLPTWESAHQVTRLVYFSLFILFRRPSAKTPAPTFTTNTPNDVVSCKDVSFGVPKTTFYISTLIFPPNR